MSLPRYPTRLMAREAICWVADAWAQAALGCEAVAFVTKRNGSKVLPWAVSADGAFVAERWDTIHKIHRKKRGFTYVCEHLRRVQDTVCALTKNQPATLEVWHLPGDPPLDAKLLLQISEQIGWAIAPISNVEIMQRISQLVQEPLEHQEHTENPLLQLKLLIEALDGQLLVQ